MYISCIYKINVVKKETITSLLTRLTFNCSFLYHQKPIKDCVGRKKSKKSIEITYAPKCIVTA